MFDPNEAANLVDRPELRPILDDLRGRLHAWMRETGDPLLRGPVPAPAGVELNDPDQESAADPTTVVA